MSDNCSHLDFAGAVCPECQEEVDMHGNTESAFKYCCFPDCGCDGARLCMAGDANLCASVLNIERKAAPPPTPSDQAWDAAMRLIRKIKAATKGRGE